jgi:hypothetical protein
MLVAIDVDLQSAIRDPQFAIEKNCRWPDSNRHGPFTAQRILSPLRLPFRHIGLRSPESKLVVRSAKINFGPKCSLITLCCT